MSADAPMTLDQLRAKAEQGDAEAQCALGHCYAQGKGVPKDLDLALVFYDQVAESSNPEIAKKAKTEREKICQQIAEGEDTKMKAQLKEWQSSTPKIRKRMSVRSRFLVMGGICLVFIVTILYFTLKRNHYYPILSSTEWNLVIKETVEVNADYKIGVFITATKYTERSTKFLNEGKLVQSRHAWIVGSLLSWYGNELATKAVPSTSPVYQSLLENRQSLLENRQAVAKRGLLSPDILKANFNNMNEQLQLFGRPQCKSLSLEE